MAKKLTLTERVIGLSFAGLLALGWGAVVYSGKLTEAIILDRATEQAKMFLFGIEQEIKARDALENEALLGTILSKSKLMMAEELIFSVERLYIYDRQGRILADSLGRTGHLQDLDGIHGLVFRTRASYLGSEIEYVEEDGRRVPRTEIIIPIHHKGRIVGALEAEIDLDRSMAHIEAIGDRYKGKIVMIFFIGGALLFAFIWWVIHTSLIRPVSSLMAVTDAIAEGRFERKVEDSACYEIARLGESIELMSTSIQNLIEEQEQAYVETLQALAKALETKDKYTAGHSGRVAHYSVLLGRRLGLDEEQLILLRQGALMHDLGKIGIPDQLLNKPGALTPEELEIMQQHPRMTATIMRPLSRFRAFTDIAAWHHERWDGKGYPDGLKGEEIPLLARIVAIADTWDAMTEDRVYRKGMSVEKALGILIAEKDDGQWDPVLVREFIDLIRREQGIGCLPAPGDAQPGAERAVAV